MDGKRTQAHHEFAEALKRRAASIGVSDEEIARKFGEQRQARIAQDRETAAKDKSRPWGVDITIAESRANFGRPPQPEPEPQRCGECGATDHPRCEIHQLELRPVSWSRLGEPTDRKCPAAGCITLESKFVKEGRAHLLYARHYRQEAMKQVVKRQIR